MTTEARSIGFSVGKAGVNRGADVKVVQSLLNEARVRSASFKAAGIAELEVDGDSGKLTIGAIDKFQQLVLGWSGPAVDGTVHPNKRTWRALNGNVASNEQIKPQADPRPPSLDGFSAFRQGDYGNSLGQGGSSISSKGCALCTLTMAASVIGSPTKHWEPSSLAPRDLTPPVANTILCKAGAFDGYMLVMGRGAEALGMTYDEYGLRPADWNDYLSADDVLIVDSNLMAGNPVAANVDYKGDVKGDHWILITKRYGGGSFGCIDPATGRGLKLTKTAPPSSTASQQGIDLKGGVLFGWGQGGTSNQQKYVVRRFALLSPASGGFCAALE